MDPFLPFAALPADVEESVGQLAHEEGGFGYSGGLYAGTEDVGIGGDVGA
jgi:hypothetical protein